MASFEKKKTTPSPFVAAMDASAPPAKVLGENASPEYTAEGIGDARVALFAGLVRDAPKLDDLVEAVARLAREKADPQVYADLAVLAFQARDCRGGKGERAAFRAVFWRVLAAAPETTLQGLLALVPEYGYYKDWFVLYDEVDAAPSAARRHAAALKAKVIELAAAQLFRDRALLDTRRRRRPDAAAAAAEGGERSEQAEEAPAAETTPEEEQRLSLLGKYAPREGKKGSKAAAALAAAMFGGESPAPKKAYRELVASLNRALGTTETKMCGKRWAAIDVAAVPSRCLAKSRQAFLNEKLKRLKPLAGTAIETGDRHPDDPDRVACRKHVREALVNKKKALKGKQLFPHELVATIMAKSRTRNAMSTLEEDVLDAQWDAIVAGVREHCDGEQTTTTEHHKQPNKPSSVDLGQVVALVDVSGSMSGVPMQVAIALGLVVAEVAAPAFRHRVLTFESAPRWHAVDPDASIVEKVRKLERAPWGGSTNFAAAIEQILDACIENKVAPDDVPDLLVLSDMQFDAANRASSWNARADAWETQHERLVRRFAEAGRAAVGAPWPPPTVTYWNLRGTAHGGFVVEADRPGARMLSGFSPALLKLLLAGDPLDDDATAATTEEVVGEDGETLVVVAKTKPAGPTPYETMRRALDDPRYDAVRLALAASTEAPFAAYVFERASSSEADDDAVLVEPPPL